MPTPVVWLTNGALPPLAHGRELDAGVVFYRVAQLPLAFGEIHERPATCGHELFTTKSIEFLSDTGIVITSQGVSVLDSENRDARPCTDYNASPCPFSFGTGGDVARYVGVRCHRGVRAVPDLATAPQICVTPLSYVPLGIAECHHRAQRCRQRLSGLRRSFLFGSRDWDGLGGLGGFCGRPDRRRSIRLTSSGVPCSAK